MNYNLLTQTLVFLLFGVMSTQIYYTINRYGEEIAQTKNEFLLTITHEFKTPLTLINAAIQTIALVCANEYSEKVGKYLKTIQQNSNRQMRLVSNLLDVTRLDSGTITPNYEFEDIVSLSKIIVESVVVYTEQMGVQLLFQS